MKAIRNVMIILLVLIVLLTTVNIVLINTLYSLVNAEEYVQTEYDLFYMYGGPKGTYWLEPTAEYENIVFVDNQSLEEWGINPTQLGEKFTGTFDETGWDLIKISEKEGKDQ